ncbi:HEAT resistant agglutinin 1 protein [Aureimonas endophytica]|uniref:HEAT resistant agglutinin 1 protein n=1 Tax=Aureimonas endophytica TaxID=2027858 RepID=A0A916ZFJ4_9HYPH|nr:outer membrane protein [Aureimonas endophytica]GGD94308.1 HEAT resistant agglutinin 1 protein [Aureimonas endophytica]
MSRSRILSTLALLLMTGGSALAADLIEQPLPVEEAPIASGWYLRGDVGYVFKDKSKGNWDFWNEYPGYEGVDDTFHYKNFELGDAASFGAGVGYRFNDMLRVDATVDYFNPDFKGSTQCPSYVAASQFGQAAPNIVCGYNDRADVDVWTAMANAYVDLPVFGPTVVPYIGAGIGAAYVDYGTMTSEQCGIKCGDPTNVSFEHEGLDDWRFAASLMAGATIDLTGALKLDAGYKYTHVTGGDAFAYDETAKLAGASGAQIRDDGFDLHTVRVGLRYEFY